MKHKIHNQKHGTANEADRLALGALLLKMGYTVKHDKEKRGEAKNSPNVAYVEYWGMRDD